MKFFRGVSGHTMELISDGRLTGVLVSMGKCHEGDEDPAWGLYAHWRNSTMPTALITKRNIETMLKNLHEKDVSIANRVFESDQEVIRLFCLTLMDAFCYRLSEPETVVNARDVVEDTLRTFAIEFFHNADEKTEATKPQLQRRLA